MKVFRDYYNNEVKLSFNDHPFSTEPKHVFVICRYKDKWLLTKHKDRGLEFPGGKVEKGETAEAAAVREVKEETGANLSRIEYVGQYYVNGKNDYVIKNVYYGIVDNLEQQAHYFETEGPILLEEIPQDVRQNPSYSFIMKDGVLEHCMSLIKQRI